MLLLSLSCLHQSSLHQVWDAQLPLIADYVRVKFDNGIVPDKVSAPVGSMVCFSTNFNLEDGKNFSLASEITCHNLSHILNGNLCI